ncbi:MAG: hypothetical protein ABI134_27690 [Byssovorax sp.]
MLASRPTKHLRFLPALLGLIAFAVLTLAPSRADAYPWMIRHEYTGCAICHGDPTGGGVLTAYGRAQGDLLLRTRYSTPKPGEEAGEPSSTAGFLWGAFEPPEWMLLGGSFRAATLVTKVLKPDQPVEARFIQMQADLRAIIRPSFFRAGASIGFVHEGGLPAAVTSGDKNNLVSREHWAGVAFKDDEFLIRAGRMNLPFGIRNIDHTLWVRRSTRTDINTAQQHGLALSYNGETLRGEVMGIFGNFQIHPDAYRDRGAVGYLEYTLSPHYTVGVNGLFTSALLDTATGTTRKRGSAGIFGRGSPTLPLVLMAEADALFDAQAGASTTLGVVGMLQADYEPKQGIHILGTGELRVDPVGVSAGGWIGAAWFFLPHADMRIDGIVQSVASSGGPSTLVTSFLGQLHFYL